MDKTSLFTILKAIWRRKFPNLRNIIILAIGMSSFMVIHFYINYENGFDNSWTDSNRIYRIALKKTLSNGDVVKSANNYSALGWVIKDEIPGIEYSTSLWEDKIMAFTPDHFIPEVKFFWGDSLFFKVFDLNFIEGDKENPFPTLQSIVISESAAKQLFGTTSAYGKSFKLNEGWEFIVSGVFSDCPSNSHLKVEILGTCNQLFYYMSHFNNSTSSLVIDPSVKSSLPNSTQAWLWSSPGAYTYVKLKKEVSPESIASGFENIYKKYTAKLIESGQKSEFIMQPVSTIHIGPNLEKEISVNIDKTTISALWIVAILTLIMSWIIFINFQITQGAEAAREIGVRKVFGASSANQALQIILQSVIINIASLFIAANIFSILRKSLSTFMGINDLIPLDVTGIVVFISLILLGSVLCGLYPAMVIVPRNAQTLLMKNFIQKNDGFGFRRALIIFQFAASIGLIASTIVIVRQVNYMKNKNIGLSISQTVYSPTPMSLIKKPGAIDKLKAFMAEADRVPGIRSTTLTSGIPGKPIEFHGSSIFPVDNPERGGSGYGILCVESHWERVYKPKILSGRLFTDDDIQGGNLLVINYEACKQLGFKSPDAAIGKFINVSVNDYLTINKVIYKICGVVDNFHQESPRKMIEPLLIINDLRWKYEVGFISVGFDVRNGNDAMSGLKEIWSGFFPNDPFGFRYTDETYQLQLKTEKKLAVVFTLYTIVSVLLAAIGLLGLASNIARKRVKEIGIRKINGATIYQILVMMNRNFLLWIALAFIIAVPISYYAMYRWLENFAYKTTLSIWIFVLSGFTAILIAMISVTWQSWKASTRNPVEALRYE